MSVGAHWWYRFASSGGGSSVVGVWIIDAIKLTISFSWIGLGAHYYNDDKPWGLAVDTKCINQHNSKQIYGLQYYSLKASNFYEVLEAKIARSLPVFVEFCAVVLICCWILNGYPYLLCFESVFVGLCVCYHLLYLCDVSLPPPRNSDGFPSNRFKNYVQ